MNSYKKLLSTTMVLAIGSFSSKVLVFLMMPFYTRMLSTSDYGTVDLIIQTCNLLIPLATIGIANSVIRFGLDRDSNKKAVFTTGIVTVLAGFVLLCLFSPLLRYIGFSQYTFLILIYVLTSSFHTVCAQFVQAKKYTRLFAVDGVLRTVLTIGLNVLFLMVFRLGVTGYVLATIISDFISVIFLFGVARLRRYISFSSLNRETTSTMLRYSIPLIPTMLCVWIISLSDRYMLRYFVSVSATGIYAVSNKIPTLLSIVASIFGDAWQISIVSEDKEKQQHFFSNVFATYQCIALIGASGLIMTAKLSTTLLASPSYYSAWECIPPLVLGIMCSCLGTFLASIYMVEKQSVYTLITTAIGAASNVILNFILIPPYHALGAAIATCTSYFLIFFIRSIHTRRFIPVDWHLEKFLPAFLLVFAQGVLMVTEPPLWILWQIVIFLIVLFLNYKTLLRSVSRILH
ncbi:oligosaccharide flippase family protein [Acidaminobacterium chupaoyuni]